MAPNHISNKIQQTWAVEGENDDSTEVYSCQFRPGAKVQWGCMFGYSNLPVEKWHKLPLGRGIKPKVKPLRGSKQKNRFAVADNMMSIAVERKYNSPVHAKFNRKFGVW
jgi:hypothetical protein